MSGFLLKGYHVEVRGYPVAFYAAASRPKAIAKAWRDYSSMRDIAFRDFLKIARANRAPEPAGFGDPILVGGAAAFRVTGQPGVNNYVQFVRPGCDQVLYSHPADVTFATPFNQETRP